MVGWFFVEDALQAGATTNNMCVCVYIYTLIRTLEIVCLCVRKYVCMHVRMYVYVCMRILYTCISVHIIHTYNSTCIDR